jgi:hypothetical protein
MIEGYDVASKKHTTHYCVKVADVKCSNTAHAPMNGEMTVSFGLLLWMRLIVRYLLAHLALIHVPRTLIVVAVGQGKKNKSKQIKTKQNKTKRSRSKTFSFKH